MGNTRQHSGRTSRIARWAGVIATVWAAVLLPATPAAAEADEPIKLALTASTANGSPELSMRVTNGRREPCALVVTPEASLQIVSMTRDDRAVKPAFGGVRYLDGLSQTLARTHRVVPAGESVTVQLGTVQPGLRAVAPTADDRGVEALWPTSESGRYEVTAVYSAPNVPDAGGPRCAGRSNTASVTFTIGDEDARGWWVWVIVGGAAALALGIGVYLIRRRQRDRRGRGPRVALVVALAVGAVVVSPMATRQAQATVDVHLGDLSGELRGCVNGYRGTHPVIDDVINVLDSPNQLIPVRVVGTMDSRSPVFNKREHPFYFRGAGDVSTTYDIGPDPEVMGITVRFDPTLGGSGVEDHVYVMVEVETGIPWDNCAELLHQLVIGYLTITDFSPAEPCERPTKGFGTEFKEMEMADEVKVLMVENLYRKKRGLPEREVPYELPDLEPDVDPCEMEKKNSGTPAPGPTGTNPGPPDNTRTESTPPPSPKLTPVPKPKKPKKKPKKDTPNKGGGKGGKPPSKSGGSNGDPHLYTLDGLAYDLQAVGEFVLVTAESGDLQVQARQAPLLDSRTVSVNSAIAVLAGKSRVAFEIDEVEDIVVRQDGKVAIPGQDEVDLGDGATLTQRPSFDGLGADGYTLRWRDGSRIWVDAISTWGLRLYVDLAPGRAGKVHGLLGDFNGDRSNDLTGRDGAAIPVSPSDAFVTPPFKELYQEFGESWRVRKAESLFDYRPNESPDTFVDRTFPDKPVTVETLPAADRERAEAVCAALGVADPALLPGCVLDVATTGLASFAVNAGEAQQVVDESDDPADPDTEPEDGPTKPGEDIGPGDTVTGRVDDQTGRVFHRFTAKAGDVAYFQADPDCEVDKARLYWDIRAEADLDAAGGELTTGVICLDLGRVQFPKDGTYVVTVHNRGEGGSGDYRFTWVPADPDQVRPLALGENASGEFDIGERHVYTFQAPDSGELATLPGPGCTDGATWQLFEADAIAEHSLLQIGFICDEDTLDVVPGRRYALVINGIGYETGGEYSFALQRR